MVKEFLELEDADVFLKVTEKSTFVIRVDPYLFAQYFGFMFYINLTRLDSEDVGKLLKALRGKFIVTRKIIKADSITDFLAKAKIRERKEET